MKLTVHLGLLMFFLLILNQNINAQDHFGLLKAPPSGSENVIGIDDNDNIYLGIWGQGIMRSSDNGTTWTSVNSGLGNKYVTEFDFTDNGEVFASTFGGGVYYSADGLSWTEKNEGIANLNTTAIKVLNDSRVFVGTYGSGMFFTEDNGETWIESNKGFDFRDVHTIGEFEATGFITAGTYGGATYMTRDSGNTWKWERTGMTNYYINDFTFNSQGEILAASNGRGLLYSVNSGVSYSEFDSLMRSEFVSEAMPLPDYNFTCVVMNSMNEPVVGTRNHGIFKYDRFTWNHWFWTGVRTDGITDMAVNSSGTIFAASVNNELYKSENGGLDWDKIDNIVDDKSAYVYPFDGENTYLAADNELFWSDDYGYTWTKKGDLPSSGELIVRDSAGIMYLGAGNGLFRSFNGGGDFSAFGYNDTIIADMSVGSDNTLYIAWLKVNQAENPNPTSWQGIDYIENGQKHRLVTLEDPINSIVADGLGGITYADQKGTFSRTDDKGDTWREISGYSGMPEKLYYDYDDNLYVLSTEGIFYSENFGSTWTDITFDVEDKEQERFLDIFVTPQDRIYVKLTANRGQPFKYTLIYYTDDPIDGEWIRADQSITQSGFLDVNQSNQGDIYAYSNMLYKAFNPHSIHKPEIVSPLDGEFLSDMNPEIKWETALKAEMYEIEISNKPNYSIRVANVVLSDTSYVVFDTLEHNVTYYFRIRSKTHDAYSDWTEGTFKTTLQSPMLEYPANDSLCVSRIAELSWFETDGAEHYIVHLSDSANFANMIVEDTVAVTNYTTPELSGYTEYYWRIKAISEDTQSAWSEVRRFRTVLNEPELIYPAHEELNVDITDTFRFKTDYSSELYNYAFVEIIGMEDNIIDSAAVISDSTFVSDSLDYSMTYQWRIGIVTECNEIIYSEYNRFSTLLNPVVLVSPEDGAESLPLDITLEWENHPELGNYHLMVARDSDFTDIIEDTEDLTETAFNLTNLQNNSVYYWKVMAYDETHQSQWSAVWSFATVLTRPQLRMPADSSENITLQPNMLWFAVEGAEYYQLQIAKDENFDDLFFSQDSIYDVTREIDMLEPETWYFWRVRAYSENGATEWSEIWAFKTKGNTPVLIYPDNGAEDIVLNETFRWTQDNEAIAYQIQIAKDENFDDLVISNDDVTDNSYQAELGEYDMTYYWRVKAIYADESSDWSEIWSFTTEPESSVRDYLSLDFALYPNPSSDLINLELNVLKSAGMKIYIIDATGRTYRNINTDNIFAGNNTLNINISDMPQGSYYLIIEVNGIPVHKNFSIIR